MHDTSDPELLAAFRDGDREAFAIMVARHQGLVRSACLRQAPAGETEDCIQAVFLVLARRPASASRAPALAAWLLRVSWYVCRRAQRGAKRRRQAEGQAAQACGRHGSIRPEALDHLDDCLAKLPERQRVAVSMQYLAERPADEVAAALGVNRDNAYQLVSRGLATLRSLLARRGIALSGPALLALLAGEAQAATAEAAATASITLSLSATPSAHAANLASGAATAMTLAAPSTITLMAASLLLAAGVTTAVVSAEPSQIPTAGPVQPVLAPSAMDKTLDQEVTLDFHGTSLVDTVDFLQRTSNQHFMFAPKVLDTPRSVTLRVANMRLRNVLAHIGRLTGTTYSIIQAHHQEPTGTVEAQTCLIQPAAAVQPGKLASGLDATGADADLRKRMDQRITFDFQDTPLTDIIGFLSQVGAVNCVVMPAVASGSSTVTLKVKEMKLQDALNWLCQMSSTSVRYVDQALVFDAASANKAAAPANPSSF